MALARPSPHSAFAARLPLALPGQRIGLLGGSFNPAHAGHRHISAIARRRLGLDRVWWIVTPGNPLKSAVDRAPLAVRVAEARRVAVAPWIDVTAFEADVGLVYTVDTLRFLGRRLPGVRFIWLMGADNLAELHRWRDWREIADRMPLAVINRPAWHLAALASPAARAFARGRVSEARCRRISDGQPPCWTLLTGPLSTLSSRAIRAAGRGGGMARCDADGARR